ncbi:efflux transporter outer membrane subunit [Jeongeupia chitinilytica]|uniref:AdeC/adeK/oprM family multidrug efflux complex outer membrane factor n=1 Tax=Jeongeupia chitinilytica TaxID=1041641 RepID=A0ABQ3H1B9_9NEIS|nr:efflux transporter outer membrane subunit [Jeongeupia chitinilytica]GHD65456.1 adeC/adeK/oprM family multidrug efflux complex outer membrane factor [Jeongeupia chitinilytica]
MKRLLMTLSAGLTLAGCAVPEPPQSQTLYKQALTELGQREHWQAGANAGAVSGDWVAQFNDPTLSALVKEALAANRNVQAAATRLDAARAQVTVDSADTLPSVNLGGRAGVKADNSQGGLNGANISASWELDLWGRVRAQARGSQAQYASVEADYYWAQQSLAADVAQYWFSALELSRRLALQQSWVAQQRKLVALTEQRVTTGIVAATEATDQQLKLQAGERKEAEIALARKQNLQALELLLGRYPAGELNDRAGLPALPDTPAQGTPTQLLERRPDVIAAERRVAAAFYRTEEAKAARLPKVSLSAGLSYIESDLFVLKDFSNPTGGGAISLLAPIFNAGALQAQVDTFSAKQREAVLNYGQTAMSAIREVESSLSSESSLAKQHDLLKRDLVAQTKQVQAETVRVRVGSRSPLNLLARQQLATETEMAEVGVRAAQLRQRVSTYLALGGPFVASPAGGDS